jgi:uncharacterized membrane protein
MANNLMGIIAWIVGVIVSIAVGFALIDGVIAVPFIGVANVIAGWIVVIGAIISVIMAIFGK